MTDWDDILKPAPVYCDGCGEAMPHWLPIHSEYLTTPVGRCHRRTHQDEACILQSRRSVGGEPVKVRESGQDKVNAHLRGKR